MADDRNHTIKALLDIVEHDRNHVMLYGGLCFPVPTFTLGQLEPLPQSVVDRILLFVSLALFVSAGVSYHFYAQRIHWKRIESVESVMEADPQRLREILFGPTTGIWATSSHLWNRGQALLVAASAA
jgi:hypothetical protein